MEFYTSVVRDGGFLLVKGYDARGRRVSDRVNFSPSLYVPSTQAESWKTISGDSVKRVDFKNMWEAHKFTKSGGVFYGNKNYIFQYIQRVFPSVINWNRRHIHTGVIDIEVHAPEFPQPDEAKWPIVCLTLYSSKLKKYLVYTSDPLKYDKTKTELNGVKPDEIIHFHFKEEGKMLKSFLDAWRKLDFDVVTGWYSREFDLPYIIHRVQRLFNDGSEEKLSPWGKIEYQMRHVKGRSLDTYDIAGVSQLDYMDLFNKFGYTYGPQESYKLDHISHVVLGEKKLSYEEYSGLSELYEKNPQKYVDYNIKDTYLVKRIDEVCDYITLACEIAYKAGTNYINALGTTAVWDTMIYRELCEQKIAIPQPRDNPDRRYDGAFVKDPVVGLHDWVVSFDVNSLYPSLIVQMNMSPETFMGMKPDVDVNTFLREDLDFSDEIDCVACNGAMFRKDKRGFLASIIAAVYAERQAIQAKVKKLEKEGGSPEEIKRLNNKQHAIKILLNSCYGALGSRFFRYYDLRIAEAITHSGQVAIQWSEKAINRHLKRESVVAIDTDSNYVALGNYVSNLEEAVRTATELEHVIEKSYDEFARVTNSYENRLVMKREVIADRGVFTAKKRYMLQVLEKDGKRLKEPKIKVTGIEAIRSSTPQVCRGWLNQMFRIIMNDGEEKTREFHKKMKDEFKKLDADEIAQSMSANNLKKYADPHGNHIYIPNIGTPMHIRGTLIHNHLIRTMQLENKYQLIVDGDKVKFVRLRVPNTIGENVIAFQGMLPREFGLHEYIDYSEQFERTFSVPIRNILDKINYSLEERNDIDAFFV